MAVTSWREVRRTYTMLALASTEASLILETERPVGGDPQLRHAIARLAPHLAFGDLIIRGPFVERIATSGEERVVVGRYTHRAFCTTYLAASRTPIELDDVVAAQHADAYSPFDHLVD